MGKPFKQELDAIKDSLFFSQHFNSSKFETYIFNNIQFPFLVVGSGGSLAVAQSCSQLIEAFGGVAKHTTPYELANVKIGMHNYNVIFVSASGKNTDIISAYRFCKENEAQSTFIVCISKDSKLVSEAKERYGDNSFLECSLPHGKDGFLAVNSSICAIGIFENIFARKYKQKTFSFFDPTDKWSDEVSNCIEATSIVALGGRWAAPVVTDFESKCTEAGLKKILMSDLRNFAHGRHHWIAKNPDTSVVCFITAAELPLAQKTLSLLPKSIHKTIIFSDYFGISATIDLMIKMFYIVQMIGERKGIDPGKPGVPTYGSKLYHINYNLLKEGKEDANSCIDIIERSTARKVVKFQSSSEQYVEIKAAAGQFIQTLSSKLFRGIVLDYDNTLIRENNVSDLVFLKCIDYVVDFALNGITICFATGRGKSIQKQLISRIPSHLQEKIFVAYYNGAAILPLNESLDLSQLDFSADLKKLYHKLNSEVAFKGIQKTLRNVCLTLEGYPKDLACARSFLIRCVASRDFSDIKFVCSDHSIDIIPVSVSKRNAVTFVERICGGSVLCIGDSGDEMGNDFELLNCANALSVGTVSTSMENCWNIASRGLLGPTATLEYFSNLKMLKRGLKFKKGYLTR